MSDHSLQRARPTFVDDDDAVRFFSGLYVAISVGLATWISIAAAVARLS